MSQDLPVQCAEIGQPNKLPDTMKQLATSLHETRLAFRLLDQLDIPPHEQDILFRMAIRKMGLRELVSLLSKLLVHYKINIA